MVVKINTAEKLHYIYCKHWHSHIILSYITVLEHHEMSDKFLRECYRHTVYIHANENFATAWCGSVWHIDGNAYLNCEEILQS